MEKVTIVNHSFCYPSLADIELLQSFFSINNWKISKKTEEADLVVVYTCAVRKEKEDLSKKLIRNAQKKLKKNAELIVTGCLPRINKKELDKMFRGKTVSAKSLDRFNTILNPKIKIQNVAPIDTIKNAEKSKKDHYYNLRIGWGCLGNCAYCAIKNVFGKPRSRPIDDITKEFEKALQKGYKNFILVSNDAGSYGVDINANLVELLDAITHCDGDYRLAISHLNPDRLQELWPSFRRFIVSKEIWQINLPIQSGSNRILKLMHRKYTVEIFKNCIKKVLKANSDIVVLTDVIVGLPQETESDFQKTLGLIEWIRRGNYKVNFDFKKFSPRPNTEASQMSGQVDEKIKQRRLMQISSFEKLSSDFKNKSNLTKLIDLS